MGRGGSGPVSAHRVAIAPIGPRTGRRRGCKSTRFAPLKPERTQNPGVDWGVSFVLSGGNVTDIGSKLVVHKLIVESCVVILKANRVNDYLVEFWRHAFASFIEAEFVEIGAGSS